MSAMLLPREIRLRASRLAFPQHFPTREITGEEVHSGGRNGDTRLQHHPEIQRHLQIGYPRAWGASGVRRTTCARTHSATAARGEALVSPVPHGNFCPLGHVCSELLLTAAFITPGLAFLTRVPSFMCIRSLFPQEVQISLRIRASPVFILYFLLFRALWSMLSNLGPSQSPLESCHHATLSS